MHAGQTWLALELSHQCPCDFCSVEESARARELPLTCEEEGVRGVKSGGESMREGMAKVGNDTDGRRGSKIARGWQGVSWEYEEMVGDKKVGRYGEEMSWGLHARNGQQAILRWAGRVESIARGLWALNVVLAALRGHHTQRVSASNPSMFWEPFKYIHMIVKSQEVTVTFEIHKATTSATVGVTSGRTGAGVVTWHGGAGRVAVAWRSRQRRHGGACVQLSGVVVAWRGWSGMGWHSSGDVTTWQGLDRNVTWWVCPGLWGWAGVVVKGTTMSK
ncbi:hypothetical protein EDB83DRAFT_2319705 [Lactarius deliciosus]|nr:hypothetical protein EDB83DRAFT_2319705 [Lactarius deliciosus]